VENKHKVEKLHLQNELTYEDLKTLGSAIDDGSKDGDKSPRPLPSYCMSACTK
jgi:hypothetical protein